MLIKTLWISCMIVLLLSAREIRLWWRPLGWNICHLYKFSPFLRITQKDNNCGNAHLYYIIRPFETKLLLNTIISGNPWWPKMNLSFWMVMVKLACFIGCPSIRFEWALTHLRKNVVLKGSCIISMHLSPGMFWPFPGVKWFLWGWVLWMLTQVTSLDAIFNGSVHS